MKRIVVPQFISWLFICWLGYAGVCLAQVSQERFQVTDIRVEGTYRVSAGTIFASLLIRVGDIVQAESE